jgi:hypothetical protein
MRFGFVQERQCLGVSSESPSREPIEIMRLSKIENQIMAPNARENTYQNENMSRTAVRKCPEEVDVDASLNVPKRGECISQSRSKESEE